MPEVDASLELALFRQAIEATTDGVVITDAMREDGPIVYVNAAFERMTGYKAEEVLGRNCRFLQGDDRSQPERSKLKRALADGLPCTVVLRNYRKDGSLFWNELSLSPVRGLSGRATHFIGIQKDVTERVRLEKAFHEHREQLEQARRALSHMATRDPLTDVANRRFLLETLAREWKRASREGVPVSLLMVDIDLFRNYNDLYGHRAGDDCVRRVADALENVLRRPADLLGRYGGDEFLALLPATDRSGALQLAEAMRMRIRDLAVPHSDSPEDDRLTVSVGVATAFPAPELEMEELVVRVERALGRAKESGRDRVHAVSEEDLTAPAEVQRQRNR